MRRFLILSTLTLSFSLRAQHPYERGVVADVPLLDAPFQFNHGYPWPGMETSLAISTAYYETTHEALFRLMDSRSFWPRMAVSAFDFLTINLPLGAAWLHEEWHRAVMGRRAISSFNDTYYFYSPIASVIAVSHVDDADLARLKAEHPDEMIRLSAAGMEAQGAQNLLFERHDFKGGPEASRFMLWFNNFSVVMYLGHCASDESQESTERMNDDEGTDIARRDFTGLDCLGWVYDLHRRDEAYSARGTHPSGVGIDRYRKPSDLSADESHYLKLQAGLAWLNFLDPFLIGRTSFTSRHPWEDVEVRWNLNLHHYLTPFGYSIQTNLFWEQEDRVSLWTLHNYFSKSGYRPGFEARYEALPCEILGPNFKWSPRLALWLQPRDQDPFATQSQLGVLASARLHYGQDRWNPYVELEAKSRGWVVGNPYLGANFSLRAGLEVSVF